MKLKQKREASLKKSALSEAEADAAAAQLTESALVAREEAEAKAKARADREVEEAVLARREAAAAVREQRRLVRCARPQSLTEPTVCV